MAAWQQLCKFVTSQPNSTDFVSPNCTHFRKIAASSTPAFQVVASGAGADSLVKPFVEQAPRQQLEKDKLLAGQEGWRSFFKYYGICSNFAFALQRTQPYKKPEGAIRSLLGGFHPCGVKETFNPCRP